MFYINSVLSRPFTILGKNGDFAERYAYDPCSRFVETCEVGFATKRNPVQTVAQRRFRREGYRKNPDDWSLADNRTDFIVDRGYTSHEHNDLLGMINANGRYYDPLLGEFISPDPYVQMPGNAQNFNRYAYCLNNPVSYSDPTGEWWQYVVVAAFIYLKTAHDNKDPETGNWDWGLQRTRSSDGHAVFGVKTNSDGTDVTGYVAAGTGPYAPAVSYNNNYGLGLGYSSPQGTSFTYPGYNPDLHEQQVAAGGIRLFYLLLCY